VTILKRTIQLFLKYKVWLLAVLKPLGAWGVGCIALVDAAAVPVPIDLIIAGYVWEDRKHFYIYVIIAALGSAVGGLLPYLLGRLGGELFLMKRVNRAKYEEMRDRFEKQEFLAVMIPSILPPPTPWKIFVFGAGVFEMRTVNFLLAVFCGRVIRDSVTALLTIEYGPKIITLATDLLNRHSRIILVIFLVLVGLLVAWIVHRRRTKHRARHQTKHQIK
jgi:membrane protein YqaA with SNARE-associated domain